MSEEYPTDHILDVSLVIEVPRGWEPEELYQWLCDLLRSEASDEIKIRLIRPPTPRDSDALGGLWIERRLYVTSKMAGQLRF
jgi:hypothetical protein